MPQLRMFGLCALALMAIALSPAVAGEKNAKQTPPEAASPVKLDYARRYAKAINLDGAMSSMMEAMIPLAVAAEIAKRPGFTEREKQALHEAAAETGVAMSPRFADAMAEQMAAIYTEEELRSLAEFYESPIGRSITAKEGALTRAGEGAGEEIVPEFAADMIRRLCKKIDCNSTTAQPAHMQS